MAHPVTGKHKPKETRLFYATKIPDGEGITKKPIKIKKTKIG